MKGRKKLFFRFVVNILICGVFLVCFGESCTLRTAAFPCAYKEYLSGVVVLVMVYLNVFWIIPRISSGFKHIRYLFLSAATIATATFCEMAMVYPQVIAIMNCQYPIHTARLYFAYDSLLVLLRNVGIITFIFTIMALRCEMRMGRMKSRFWVKHHGSLVLTSIQRMLFEVPVYHVRYCEKCGNQIRFYLVDGNTGYMNGTMSDITGMMGKRGVQISRSTYVMLQHISDYTYDTLSVLSEGEETVTFKISNSYREHVHQRIAPFVKPADNPDKSSDEKQDNLAVVSRYNETMGRKPALIYSFIADHPLCSTEDIMTKTSLSRSSVAKYIAKLKKQGLIRHVGANKTGGYRIVERLEIIDES
ncbi:MAG: LytTR family transcriptional regulator DNA-binding domain-containing protein [Bacteroidales bacterium]|nr:LytTR family transcriptional regulator DNA-binding domain-containing protein [Bacteroidales bacterium]